MNIYEDADLYPYLTGAMLAGRKSVRVIEFFGYEEIYSLEARRKVRTPVLKFRKTDKKLILSRTNIDIIVSLYGPETDDWIGQPVELYAKEMTVAGKAVLPIRISSHKPQPQAPQSTTKGAAESIN